MSPDVLSFLSASTEYHLLDVVNDAANFRARGKRSRLTVDDINASLELRGAEVSDCDAVNKTPVVLGGWTPFCCPYCSIGGGQSRGRTAVSYSSICRGEREIRDKTWFDGFVSVRFNSIRFVSFRFV